MTSTFVNNNNNVESDDDDWDNDFNDVQRPAKKDPKPNRGLGDNSLNVFILKQDSEEDEIQDDQDDDDDDNESENTSSGNKSPRSSTSHVRESPLPKAKSPTSRLPTNKDNTPKRALAFSLTGNGSGPSSLSGAKYNGKFSKMEGEEEFLACNSAKDIEMENWLDELESTTAKQYKLINLFRRIGEEAKIEARTLDLLDAQTEETCSEIDAVANDILRLQQEIDAVQKELAQPLPPQLPIQPRALPKVLSSPLFERLFVVLVAFLLILCGALVFMRVQLVMNSRWQPSHNQVHHDYGSGACHIPHDLAPPTASLQGGAPGDGSLPTV